jgi:hypothetical protein
VSDLVFLHVAWFSAIVSVSSAIVWVSLFIMNIRMTKKNRRDRPLIVLMPIVGFIVSVGSLGSIAGAFYIMRYGESSTALAALAAIGRGALLMGGIIGFMYYRQERHD